MSLTTTQEHDLIVAAQAGDGLAKLQLLEEYRGNIQSVIDDLIPDPTDDRRADLESELTAEFLQAINNLDSNDTRVWSKFGTSGVYNAKLAWRKQQQTFGGETMDATMKRVMEVEIRMADLGESLEDACRYAQISTGTFLKMRQAADTMDHDELDEGRKDRINGKVRGAYEPAGYRPSVADAETALDAMTTLQRYLAEYKYGFDPADFDLMTLEEQAEDAAERDSLPAHGRSDAAVANWYNSRGMKPLTRSGGETLARRTVADEIEDGLEAGCEAILLCN